MHAYWDCWMIHREAIFVCPHYVLSSMIRQWFSARMFVITVGCTSETRAGLLSLPFNDFNELFNACPQRNEVPALNMQHRITSRSPNTLAYRKFPCRFLLCSVHAVCVMHVLWNRFRFWMYRRTDKWEWRQSTIDEQPVLVHQFIISWLMNAWFIIFTINVRGV